MGPDIWGDPVLMNFELLKRLDEFRTFINKPIIVTCGTNGNHATKSRHFSGEAVDVVIPGSVSHLDSILNAFRFFGGIGFYPHWKYNEEIVGGLHLDLRPQSTTMAQWMGVLDPSGRQIYLPLNEKNLRNYKVI